MIGEGQKGNGTAARHVAAGAVGFPRAPLFGLFGVTGIAAGVVADGGFHVGVRVVAGDAGQRAFTGEIALAGGEANGGETNAGGVFDFWFW